LSAGSWGPAMATPRRKTPSRRLLVLACSSRKLQSTEPLPAIKRYDGVAYRVINRLHRLGQYPEDVDVVIVSAKYGAITSDKLIQNYDQRMTTERAAEQVEDNRVALAQLLQSRDYKEVFISTGKTYLLALEPFDAWRGAVLVTVNRGKIGVQLKALKEWLLQQG
jgi:hypothetical protein